MWFGNILLKSEVISCIVYRWYSFLWIQLSVKLTWRWSHCDHEGSASRVRSLHCTSVDWPLRLLKSGKSSVQFLLVGTAYARPSFDEFCKWNLVTECIHRINWIRDITTMKRICLIVGRPICVVMQCAVNPRVLRRKRLTDTQVFKKYINL